VSCAESAGSANYRGTRFEFAKEYDIERKWRECRLYQIAPISTNLVLAYVAQHVLGLERSY
jgi:acyl-CoA dehydrogenase